MARKEGPEGGGESRTWATRPVMERTWKLWWHPDERRAKSAGGAIRGAAVWPDSIAPDVSPTTSAQRWAGELRWGSRLLSRLADESGQCRLTLPDDVLRFR